MGYILCKAIDDMIKESKAEGKAEGIAEGKAEGKAEGIAEGKAKGKAEGKAEGILEVLAGLVKDGLLTGKEAAVRANMTETAFQAAIKKFF